MAKAPYKTRQMAELLHFLESVPGRHVTVNEICDYFKTKGISVGTTTVYRHLEKMVSEGIVAKYVVDGTSSACFEYIGAGKPEEQESCYHCKCEKCGKLIHLHCHAMISVGVLAIGYLLMNLFATGPNISGDVCSTLFGSTSILTLTKEQVALCSVLSVCVVVLFIVFYQKIFCVTFDETFAKATGMNTDFYNLLIAVITAVIIVLAMNLVGSLLISALVIFPALSAMRIFKTFFSVTLCSVILSVSCAVVGILISILAGTPVGSTIVVADMAAFLLSCAVGKIAGGRI